VNAQDRWSKWLLESRFGGDEEAARRGTAQLEQIRDRVLKNAAIQHGETVLDVGCGDGLLSFGALDRVGNTGKVIFSDISAPLIEHCKRFAEAAGDGSRCIFLRASADDLSRVHDTSVDVVTTRSVLIYVKDKARAFEEFFRVLRPGGRVALFEPINRFRLAYGRDSWLGTDIPEVSVLAHRLRDHFFRLQPPDSDPMMDFRSA
jgi:ubiquinone/menaquinone biosynthesis C-methylase UbiE